MYNYMFFVYLAASMVGFFVLVSISLFFKNDGKISKAQNYLRAVALCYLLLCILYIVIDYYHLIMIHQTETNTFYRITDITVWILTKYFWYMFILECTILTDEQKSKFKLLIRLTLIPIILISAFNYGYFMNSDYYVADLSARKFVLTIQFVSVCTTLILNIVFFVIAHKKCYYIGIKN